MCRFTSPPAAFYRSIIMPNGITKEWLRQMAWLLPGPYAGDNEDWDEDGPKNDNADCDEDEDGKLILEERESILDAVVAGVDSHGHTHILVDGGKNAKKLSRKYLKAELKAAKAKLARKIAKKAAKQNAQQKNAQQNASEQKNAPEQTTSENAPEQKKTATAEKARAAPADKRPRLKQLHWNVPRLDTTKPKKSAEKAKAERIILNAEKAKKAAAPAMPKPSNFDDLGCVQAAIEDFDDLGCVQSAIERRRRHAIADAPAMKAMK